MSDNAANVLCLLIACVTILAMLALIAWWADR